MKQENSTNFYQLQISRQIVTWCKTYPTKPDHVSSKRTIPASSRNIKSARKERKRTVLATSRGDLREFLDGPSIKAKGSKKGKRLPNEKKKKKKKMRKVE